MYHVSRFFAMKARRTVAAFALAALSLVVSSGAYAQGSTTGTTGANFTNVGSSGATFTKDWVGARASAMAGGFSALANDVSALYWNPAGIARLNGVNVSATYTRWFGDVSHNFLGAVMPISDKYRLGLSMTVVDYGDLRRASIEKDYQAGNFNANDLAIGVTFAAALTDRFSFGGTVKYIRNSILDMSASGFAFDAGSLYQTDFYNMKISLNLSNLGPDQNFQGNSLSLLATNEALNSVQSKLNTTLATSNFALPLKFDIGVATDVFQGKMESQKLNVALDFSTHSDGPEQFNLGGEYVWDDMVAIRAGYAFNQDQLGLGAGAGFHYKSEDFSGTVDYSLNPTKNFGILHRITISAAFQ